MGIGWSGRDGQCRLDRPIEFINPALLERQLAGLRWPFRVELLEQCESTNSLLQTRARDGAPHCSVLACEHQSAGRGRRGSPWLTMPGAGLAFSVLWRSGRAAGELSGISLAVGVALARAAEGLGAPRIGLKWPNDLILSGAKLGGILVEMQGGVGTGSALVIGIGLNVCIPQALRRAIDVPVADLSTGGNAPSRTMLLARLLSELGGALELFEGEGFGPLRNDWLARHVMQDMPVALKAGERRIAEGTAVGVGDDGALLLQVAGRVERFYAGELSLRAR